MKDLKIVFDSDVPHPNKAYDNDSGFDLYSAEKYRLIPFSTKVVDFGLRIQLPDGCEGQIRPRSSSSKKGLLIHLGTIDQGYTGPLKGIVTNLNKEVVFVEKHQRIAQLVVCALENVQLVEVAELDESQRGERGFGSSGK